MSNWSYKNNLKKYLCANLILFLLIPLIIFNITLILISHYHLKSSTFNDITATSKKQTDFFNGWLEERLVDVKMIADSPAIHNFDIPEIENYFDRILEQKQNHFYNLIITNKGGQPLCIRYQSTATQNQAFHYQTYGNLSKRLMNINFENRNYFQEALKGNESISDVLMGKISQTPLVVFSVPIFDKNQFQGVVIGTVDPKEFSNIFNLFNHDLSYQTYLVNKNGTMISESPYLSQLNLNDKNRNTAILNFQVKTLDMQKTLKDQRRVNTYQNYMNQKVIGMYQPLSYHDWVLITEKNYNNSLINYLKRYALIVIGFSLLTLFIALPFTLVMSHNLAKPLNVLTNLTTKIADGQWDQLIVPTRIEEIQKLACHFNQMTSKLQETMVQLEKKNSELNELSRLKSEFVANMSHELRTPLNSIIGFTEIVKLKTLDHIPDKQTKNLETVIRNAHNLLNMINQMLDLSKIEAGKMDLFLEEFNVISLIDEVSYLAYPLAEKKGLIISKIAPASPVTIVSDYAKLKQILINLLSNAIKFTDKGKINIMIDTQHFNSNSYLTIKVKDTGQGIKEEHLERIFEAFRQADGSIARKVGGTGLGLSISMELCKLLSGNLEVASTYGEGSIFTVTLPFNSPNPKQRKEDLS